MGIWRPLARCLQTQLPVVLYQVLAKVVISSKVRYRYEFSQEGGQRKVEETKLLPVLGRWPY